MEGARTRLHVVDCYKSWKRDGGLSRWRIEPAASGIGSGPREQKSSSRLARRYTGERVICVLY